MPGRSSPARACPDPGLRALYRRRLATPTPAAFLDRDGVVVEEVNYLYRVEDVRILPGVIETIRGWNEAGTPVVLVTNQAGVGRGYYGWPDFLAVQGHIEGLLQRHGAWLDGTWACGYHPDGLPPLNEVHAHRKPGPGMLREAAQVLNLDLERSWLIGDQISDLQAAIAAGLHTAVLVRTGYGAKVEGQLAELACGRTRVYAAASLAEATQHLPTQHLPQPARV